VVITLTDKQLDPVPVSISRNRFNFGHAKTSISNVREVISGLERAVLHLPVKTAKEIQNEICCILKHSKTQKNTSKAEQDILLLLWKDKYAIVLLTDKGNTTVIMTTTILYLSKFSVHLLHFSF
jgi:hypothetical protein